MPPNMDLVLKDNILNYNKIKGENV